MHKAELLRECQMRGLEVHPDETCTQLRGHLATTPRASETVQTTHAPLRTCAARDSKWVTEILQVFPLRRSIPTRAVGGSRGVYMAEMQATALPVQALGPDGMQTVAELAALHSGRAVQMKACRDSEDLRRRRTSEEKEEEEDDEEDVAAGAGARRANVNATRTGTGQQGKE